MSRALSVWYFRDEGDDDTDEPRTVRTGVELDALLDDVLANEQPHATVVVARDRPISGPLNLPDHQVKFSADPTAGVAALYVTGPFDFIGETSETDVRGAWVTRRTRSAGLSDTTTLWLDRDADIRFPADAAIPLDELRDALHEFLRTAKRPTCVDWQETDVF